MPLDHTLHVATEHAQVLARVGRKRALATLTGQTLLSSDEKM